MTNSDVFGGASRFRGYEDTPTTPEDQDVTSALARTKPGRSIEESANESPEHVGVSDPPSGPHGLESEPAGSSTSTPAHEVLAGQLLTAEDAEVARTAAHSRSAWKAFLTKFGVHSGPSKAEIAQREAQRAEDETTIRQQTWTRAVNIGVLSSKGGAGTTPGALLTGGILAAVRGGGVAVIELTQSPGALAFRAEGRPRRGLGELLKEAALIESAGNLAGYTAPQTSHAAVIGTVSERPQLTPRDVSSVRAVLDTYYQLTVSDMDSNLASPTSLAAQRSMDGVIIPCTAENLSLARATETALHLTKSAPHLFTSTPENNPVVIVVGHDGSPEDEEIAAAATHVLRRESRNLVHVVECPYDPIFTSRREISLSDATPATRAAWTRAVATVVARLNDSAPAQFTEGEIQS